jgi:two-component system response regulator
MEVTGVDSRIILLVEDNPDDVVLTLRAFKKNHILNPVVVARDGVEALDYLHGKGPHANRDTAVQPVVMLLDLKLPRLSGLEVLHHVRSDPRTALLRVVVLTSSREDQDIAQSYTLGANSYIRKPVDFDNFLTAVGQLGMYWLLLNEAPPVAMKAS